MLKGKVKLDWELKAFPLLCYSKRAAMKDEKERVLTFEISFITSTWNDVMLVSTWKGKGQTFCGFIFELSLSWI